MNGPANRLLNPLDAPRLHAYSSTMATGVSAAPQKINLRRPDIMEAVQAQVLTHYRSELVERIRAGGGVLSAGELTVKLAKEFGLCYGVERANALRDRREPSVEGRARRGARVAR